MSRLWQSGELVAGAVALPAQGITLATPMVPAPRRARDTADRRVAHQAARRLRSTSATASAALLVEMGSAGAKVASVVQGIADVYVHAGGQYEWDNAAPVAVARAAGLHASRIDGSRTASTTGATRCCPTS